MEVLSSRRCQSNLDVHLSADGKRVLYKQGQDWHVAGATGGHNNDKVLKLDGMRTRIDPRQERAEMYENAWRVERDLFFSSVMNGNDWQAVHDSYAKLVPLVGTRDDLNYVIGQMLSELGSSHTYVGGGDSDNNTAAVPTALLGVDYHLDEESGRYRFAKIYHGDNPRKEYRSPLTEPGINVHAGDYLLAVNGHELKAPATPGSLQVGVGGPAPLIVAAAGNGPTREVLVEPLKSETSVREQDGIDHNRERVNRPSGDRVGYVYVSDTQSLGMGQFVRQFYPPLNKQALVIDERWSNRGDTGQIVLERLRRVLIGMQTTRDRAAQTQPDQVLDGPKVMLVNHYCGSDGDIFPFYFRAYGLGKLIGTRTWDGVRGIRTFRSLLDGGCITVPEISFYDLEGHWVIENHGVDPDVEVGDVPGEYLDDHDIQLETGVKTLLDELAQQPRPVVQPPPLLPAYPEAGMVKPFGSGRWGCITSLMQNPVTRFDTPFSRVSSPKYISAGSSARAVLDRQIDSSRTANRKASKTMNQNQTPDTANRTESTPEGAPLPSRRPEDVIIVLLELQPQIVPSSRTQPETQLRRAVSVLTKCARELGIPVLASVVPLAPGTAPELIDELVGYPALSRTTVSALDDEPIKGQLASSGRKVLALGGVSSEIALLRTALSARHLQYEVHLLVDCCGGLGERSERAAFQQMEAAGVVPSSVLSFLTALIPDISSANGQIVMTALAAFWS